MRLRSGKALVNALLVLYLAEVIAVLVATVLLRTLPPEPALPSVWYYSPLLRVWEFLLGCVVGVALPALQRGDARAGLARLRQRARSGTARRR